MGKERVDKVNEFDLCTMGRRCWKVLQMKMFKENWKGMSTLRTEATVRGEKNPVNYLIKVTEEATQRRCSSSKASRKEKQGGGTE